MEQRRTLEEVYRLYSLEPDLRDVYVEGSSDKYFVDWYLHRKDIKNVTVYNVDLIDIPDEILAKHTLPVGSNRSRVIALSCELAGRQAEQRRVLCVIDRDYEDYCPACKINPYLALTDGNSLELYSLTPSVVKKFLMVTLGGFPMSAGHFITRAISILERVFVIRLANEQLRWGMEWVDFTRFVDIDGDDMAFREEVFIRTYLQKNNKWTQRDQFKKSIEDARMSLQRDLGRRIRGHDLAELVFLMVKKLRRERKFGNWETLEACLLTAIEACDLEVQPLFRRIAALSE